MLTWRGIAEQGWKWVAPVNIDPFDPLNNKDMTHLWPTCWSFLFKNNVTWYEKILIWNNAIDFFIVGRIPNQSLAQTSRRWNLWTIYASKQLYIIFTPMIFQWIYQTQSSLTYQMPILFLKNMWYLGHIQII